MDPTKRLVSKSRTFTDNAGILIVATYGYLTTVSYLPCGFTTETTPTASITTRNDECISGKANHLIDIATAKDRTDEQFRSALRELGAALDAGYPNLVCVSILSACERMSKSATPVAVG
jgi:hypothetical protein